LRQAFSTFSSPAGTANFVSRFVAALPTLRLGPAMARTTFRRSTPESRAEICRRPVPTASPSSRAGMVRQAGYAWRGRGANDSRTHCGRAHLNSHSACRRITALLWDPAPMPRAAANLTVRLRKLCRLSQFGHGWAHSDHVIVRLSGPAVWHGSPRRQVRPTARSQQIQRGCRPAGRRDGPPRETHKAKSGCVFSQLFAVSKVVILGYCKLADFF